MIISRYAGGDPGFNSYFMRFAKQELTIVCFSNLNASGGAEQYARKVGEILMRNGERAKTGKEDDFAVR